MHCATLANSSEPHIVSRDAGAIKHELSCELFPPEPTHLVGRMGNQACPRGELIVLYLSARLSVLMHALVSPPFGRQNDTGIA